MSEIRDGIETAEQAIYESLGLALPGLVAIVCTTCVLAPDALSPMLRVAGSHPWIALGLCYLAGRSIAEFHRPRHLHTTGSEPGMPPRPYRAPHCRN